MYTLKNRSSGEFRWVLCINAVICCVVALCLVKIYVSMNFSPLSQSMILSIRQGKFKIKPV